MDNPFQLSQGFRDIIQPDGERLAVMPETKLPADAIYRAEAAKVLGEIIGNAPIVFKLFSVRFDGEYVGWTRTYGVHIGDLDVAALIGAIVNGAEISKDIVRVEVFASYSGNAIRTTNVMESIGEAINLALDLTGDNHVMIQVIK